MRQHTQPFEVLQIRARLRACYPDTLDTNTEKTGLTNLLPGTAIGRGSVIASTPPTSPSRLLPPGSSTPGVVQPNPQHTNYQVKGDETDEDVFFEEFNSGFLETSRSFDSTLPQGESSSREEWISRRDSTENHDFTSGTRDKAYTAGSPLDHPRSRERVYSSPQNVDYFLDIKPVYTPGPEHPVAQADNIETVPALTDSPELASAQDVSQGET